MRILVIQHTREEGPGTLLDWARSRGEFCLVHRIFEYPNLPPPEEFQLLVVLGGTMNVDQENEFPWLAREKVFIRSWIESGKPYLGICLGGQLLSRAFGSKVEKNNCREIGFHSVRKVQEHPLLSDWPMETMVYQWHEDTFYPPSGAAVLMSSEACERQAFALGDRQLALQFHPEASCGWIVNNHSRLPLINKEREPFVQNARECEPFLQKQLPILTQNFHRLLDKFRDF